MRGRRFLVGLRVRAGVAEPIPGGLALRPARPSARAIELLRRCVDAMADGGKILVVESVLLPGSGRNEGRFLDLEMLAMTVGGRQRNHSCEGSFPAAEPR